MTSGSLHDTQLAEMGDDRDERLAQRVAELFDNDPQFRAAAPLPEVIEAACTPGLRLTEVFETIVEGYADRPALGQRARELVTDRRWPYFRTTAAAFRDHQLPRSVGPSARDRQRLEPRPREPRHRGGCRRDGRILERRLPGRRPGVRLPRIGDRAPAAKRSGVETASDHRGMRTEDRRGQRGVPRPGGGIRADQCVAAAADGVRLPTRGRRAAGELRSGPHPLAGDERPGGCHHGG